MTFSNRRFWVPLVGVSGVLALAWAYAVWLPSKAAVDTATGDGAIVEAAENDEPNHAEPRIVQLASADLARRIGIETATVTQQNLAQRLDANAETAYNGQQTAEVLARVSGIVKEVRVELNQVVRRGDVLAVIDSSAVGSAKAQYLNALAAVKLAEATYDRYHSLAEKQIAAGKNELEALTAMTQAKTSLLEAKQHLFNFGFAQSDLDAVQRDQSASNLLDVVAPIDGSVITWDAALGEAVEPTTQLFGISDTSQFWLWIDVYESDIDAVQVGQLVTFTVSNKPGLVFLGRITAISTEADRTSRTTRVRAQIGNSNGRLRANVFGRARITITPEHEATVVPTVAVQREGEEDIVFVPEAPGKYRRQLVVTKPIDATDLLEVVKGLEPGQQVVTTGAFLLYSELVKDRIAEDVD